MIIKFAERDVHRKVVASARAKGSISIRPTQLHSSWAVCFTTTNKIATIFELRNERILKVKRETIILVQQTHNPHQMRLDLTDRQANAVKFHNKKTTPKTATWRRTSA